VNSKTIAVDLDDTLNNFTEVLQRGEFVRNDTHALSEERFQDYLVKLRAGSPGEGDLLSTEYSFFRYKIHQECYQRARPRADGVAFLRWLREHHWRIVICTQRDLRRAQDCTRDWLRAHDIPFDHLFMAGNKIVFCRIWGIAHLVDDDGFNIAHGEPHGVSVYYPAGGSSPAPAAQPASAPHAARAFQTFDEIIPWIQG
jgi:uncharacterized HAD superfamily protein